MTRPTARGAALLAIGVASYGAARLVGTWELYMMGFALMAAVLVTWLQVRAIGGRLSVTRSVAPLQPVAGDPMSLSFRVESTSSVPGQQVTLLHAGGELSGRDEPIHVESLGSRGERVVTAGPWPARRGIYYLPACSPSPRTRWALSGAAPTGHAGYRRRAAPATSRILRAVRRDGRPRCGSRRVPMLRGSEFAASGLTSRVNHLAMWIGKPLPSPGTSCCARLRIRRTAMSRCCSTGRPRTSTGSRRTPTSSSPSRSPARWPTTPCAVGNATTLLLPEHDWRPIRLTPDANGHVRLLQILAGVKPQGLAQLGPSLRGLVAGRRRSERTRTVILVVTAMDDSPRARARLPAPGGLDRRGRPRPARTPSRRRPRPRARACNLLSRPPAYATSG